MLVIRVYKRSFIRKEMIYMSFDAPNIRQQKIRNPYITPVNITLVAINIGIFFIGEFITKASGNVLFLNLGAMHPALVLYGQWYRLITATFLHSDISHLINNMLLLICLGSCLEKAIGKVKYLIFYFASGIVSSLVSMGWMLYSENIAWSIGASGVVFAVMGAVLFIVIRNRGRFNGYSIKRYMVMLVLSLYFGFTTAGVDNAAHVGGAIVGFILGSILYRKRKNDTVYYSEE